MSENQLKKCQSDVQKEKIINDAVGGVPIVVVWYDDLNTVKIFERNLKAETLNFEFKNNKIMDNNGNEWTVEDMIDKIEIVDTFGHFWFAWAAFFPNTELYQA